MKSHLLTLTTLLPLVHSWSFIWRNASGDATVLHGNQPRKCININHAKGQEFQWDPQGGEWCIYLYGARDCKNGTSGGYTCKTWGWNHKSSGDINSFDVEEWPPGYGTTAGLMSTVTVTPTTGFATTSYATAKAKVTVTATAAPTALPAGSGDALSGGGIAGVVIGVLVAVALVGALAFLFGRRTRPKHDDDHEGDAKSSVAGRISPTPGPLPPNSSPGGSPIQEKPLTMGHMTQVTSPTTTVVPSDPSTAGDPPATYRPPGSRMVELVGNNGTQELSDHNRVLELAGDTEMRPNWR